MKKVLFVGHFNDQTKQIQKELSKFVSIQLCSDNVTIAESMMGIYEPDLVLVNVEGFTDGHLEFFQILAEKYVMTPVVIIGSEAAYRRYALYDMSMMQAVNLIGETVIDLGIRISAIYMIIAGADFMYQKYKFKNDMKMTKQEVKEEYKNAEGDPEIKGKIKARMREASQRRMMQAIPKADVVITNPTHYAVAIQYDTEVAPAPIVVAKGSDYLAQKIKEIARENNIEIVEDKPLARMLYANVDVDKQIPPELYQAVAEVLAMVYHAQGRV